MKIGIAGAGGIGSNVAVHLVRYGFRSLKIVDFDRVEASNLNRQFYFHDQIGHLKVEMLARNLNRITADLNIETRTTRLEQSNMAATFADCPIVVEGFDGKVDKKHFLEAFAESNQWVISASGVAGRGVNAIAVRTLGHCTIVGDFTTDCCDAGLYSHKVAAIAAIMAGEVIKRSCDINGKTC